MSRPSRNIDKLLIKTGLDMIIETGVTGLNIREVVQRAGVNLGMFHYHFKTKEAFARLVLQELYEVMFARLMHSMDPQASTMDQLQNALLTLGTFARDHRTVLLSLVMDVKQGDRVALDFIKANFPRHFLLLMGLVLKAQAEGSIIPLPPSQIMTFLAIGVAVPALFGGLALNLDAVGGKEFKTIVQDTILSDLAIEQRVRMALKGVSS